MELISHLLCQIFGSSLETLPFKTSLTLGIIIAHLSTLELEEFGIYFFLFGDSQTEGARSTLWLVSEYKGGCLPLYGESPNPPPPPRGVKTDFQKRENN